MTAFQNSDKCKNPMLSGPQTLLFYSTTSFAMMLQVGQNIFQSFSRDADAQLDWKAAVDSWYCDNCDDDKMMTR